MDLKRLVRICLGPSLKEKSLTYDQICRAALFYSLRCRNIYHQIMQILATNRSTINEDALDTWNIQHNAEFLNTILINISEAQQKVRLTNNSTFIAAFLHSELTKHGYESQLCTGSVIIGNMLAIKIPYSWVKVFGSIIDVTYIGLGNVAFGCELYDTYIENNNNINLEVSSESNERSLVKKFRYQYKKLMNLS